MFLTDNGIMELARTYAYQIELCSQYLRTREFQYYGEDVNNKFTNVP